MSKIHYGRVDKNGNFRDRTRKEDGFLIPGSDGRAFPAMVTAWYPRSQTIDVIVPTNFGMQKIKGVVVYGDFFEVTGTIRGPKIATTLEKEGYTAYRSPAQSNPGSDKYVLDNHIEALVKETTVGYASSEFRFLSPDSPMLNNAKVGRTITRHDDGSYYIHDHDGNMQFKHPSGLNIRIGSTDNDIELEDPFADHAKNKLAYATGVKFYIEYPAGGKIGYTDTGLLQFSNAVGTLKTDVLDKMLDHNKSTLECLDSFLSEYIDHFHPCIFPTGVPTTAANAVSLQIDAQLEISGVSATKSTLALIME